MNKVVRRLLGACIGGASIHSGCRRRAVRRLLASGNVLCLFSHDPALPVLERQVRWLKNTGFRFVSQDEVLGAVERRGALPRGSVWLSFDDGWQRNLTDVVPVLKREGIPATFFIAPEAIRIGRVWTDFLRREDRSRIGVFLAMRNDERRARMPGWVDAARANGRANRLLMTADSIANLASNGLFRFENHTLTHASAVSCSAEGFLREVREADSEIAEWTGRRTSLLCYPFGLWNADCEQVLRTNGWLPVTSDPGMLSLCEGQRPSRLPRNLFYDRMSLAENSCRSVGAWLRISSNRLP